jgi:hypothetical protein
MSRLVPGQRIRPIFVVRRPSPEDQQGHDESAPLSGDAVQTGAFDEGVECMGRRQVALQMALAERAIVPGRIREPLVTPIDQRLLSPRATALWRGPRRRSAPWPRPSSPRSTTCYVTALSTTILAQTTNIARPSSRRTTSSRKSPCSASPARSPCTETGAVSIQIAFDLAQ